MAGTNTANLFSADVPNFIAKKTLPLTRRQLVVYQFGDPATLPKGMGVTYTASRYVRVPLPTAPLSEGVPPVGQQMTLQQVTAQAQQWGDRITITDVAEMTIYHPLFKKATELLALQIGETLERNTFTNLMSGSQINYVNSRGSRGALAPGDVINPHEINRATAMLEAIGAPRYMGDEVTDMKVEADAGGARASSNPRQMPHYVAVMHPFVMGDFRENSTVVTAWSYSDINRLYNYEAGEWGGIRFCKSNMVPYFLGGPALTGLNAPTAVAGGGNFQVGNYTFQVVAQDPQTQFERVIYPISALTAVAAGGSVTITTPNTPGYTYEIYASYPGVLAGATPTTLAATTSGPTTGPLAGMATQIPPNTAVVLTGNGISQVPPAAPGVGITVWPTFIFGRGAYAQVVLDDVKFTYLKEADKSDPLNQLRVLGWKNFYGTLIQNQNFFMRIESTSAFNATFG